MSRRRNAGFSLLELVVAFAITSVVAAFAFQTFTAQHEAYTVVDQVTEAQQNMRAIANLLERDARAAGFMVPEAAAACAVDHTANGTTDPNPDVIFLSDANSINPANQVASLSAAITVAPALVGNQTLSLDNVVLDGAPFYDTDNDGVLDSDFQVNGGVIVANSSDPTQGTSCGVVTAVNLGGNSLQVNFVTPNAIGFAPTDDLIAVPAHVYQIVPAGAAPAPQQPQLTRNGQLLANDVEDLQLAMFFDLDTDGLVDNGEDLGSGDVGPADPPYQADNFDHRLLREIRVNLVVRSRDQGSGANANLFIQSQQQATENRAPNNAIDGFRRRVHTTTVRLRNVGFRGAVT